MSNGDDDAEAGDADGADEPESEPGTAGETEETALSADTLDERLVEAEAALDEAETEADLDDVEADLDAISEDIEAADLPEPDEDDEDADDPQAELEDRLSDLREDLADQRGPYAEDVTATVEEAETTLTDTRWTEDGEASGQHPEEITGSAVRCSGRSGRTARSSCRETPAPRR